MRIGSHHSHFVLCDIKENSVHYRTQVVICGSKNRLLNSTLQHIGRNNQRTRLCLNTRHLRILIAVHSHKRIGTILTNHADCKVILIDGKHQRLLAELPECLQQQLGCRSYFAATFYTLYFHTRTNCRLAVRSGQLQLITYQIKQHVIQNRQRVFAVNHAAYCLQLRKEF